MGLSTAKTDLLLRKCPLPRHVLNKYYLLQHSKYINVIANVA